MKANSNILASMPETYVEGYVGKAVDTTDDSANLTRARVGMLAF